MRLILACVAAAAIGLSVSSAQATITSSKIVGWASVYGDGTLRSYKNVTANYHLGNGDYAIDFVARVSKCAFTATVRGNHGQILSVAIDETLPHRAYVTSTRTGTPTDTEFDLVAIC
jgi:opacity protein-like surface antigen